RWVRWVNVSVSRFRTVSSAERSIPVSFVISETACWPYLRCLARRRSIRPRGAHALAGAGVRTQRSNAVLSNMYVPLGAFEMMLFTFRLRFAAPSPDHRTGLSQSEVALCELRSSAVPNLIELHKKNYNWLS